jgi:hypothetical protein
MRPIPQYRIGRGEIARMAFGSVEKLLTFRVGYDPSIDVQSKACNM